jgi:hypothetical protein
VQGLRYTEFARLFPQLSKQERHLVCRLAVLPRPDAESWARLENVVLEGLSADLLEELTHSRVLESERPVRSFGHDTRHEAAMASLPGEPSFKEALAAQADQLIIALAEMFEGSDRESLLPVSILRALSHRTALVSVSPTSHALLAAAQYVVGMRESNRILLTRLFRAGRLAESFRRLPFPRRARPTNRRNLCHCSRLRSKSSRRTPGSSMWHRVPALTIVNEQTTRTSRQWRCGRSKYSAHPRVAWPKATDEGHCWFPRPQRPLSVLRFFSSVALPAVPHRRTHHLTGREPLTFRRRRRQRIRGLGTPEVSDLLMDTFSAARLIQADARIVLNIPSTVRRPPNGEIC